MDTAPHTPSFNGPEHLPNPAAGAFTPENPGAAMGPNPAESVFLSPAAANQEAAPAGPLARVAQKIGNLARAAYEKTQVTVGMAMAGVRPEAAPAEAHAPATAPEGRNPIAALANRLTNGNFLRGATLAAGLGTIAITALRAHHGIDTGSAGNGHNFQTVANVTSSANTMQLAAGHGVEHQEFLDWAAGATAAALGLGPGAYFMLRDKNKRAREYRAEAARLTREQDPRVDHATATIVRQPSAERRIIGAAQLAEARRLDLRSQHRTGLPLHLQQATQAFNTATGRPMYPPGFDSKSNKLAFYYPTDSQASRVIHPPSSKRLWRFWRRKTHFDY